MDRALSGREEALRGRKEWKQAEIGGEIPSVSIIVSCCLTLGNALAAEGVRERERERESVCVCVLKQETVWCVGGLDA